MRGADIAWQKPSGAALAAAGVSMASLYVGQDNTGKNMTLAVVEDYVSHGVAVITNFEYGAMQMNGGAAQGRTDALLGLSQKRACNIPDSRPTIFSADWPATASEIANNIIPYLVAARGVLGAGRVGVYGSYYTVKAVADYWAAHYPGEKIWLWQTVGWSNGLVDQRIDFFQDGKTFTVVGIPVDEDIPQHLDVGQYPAPAATHKLEDTMLILREQGSTSVYALDGGILWGVSDPVTLQSYIDAGIPQASVSADEIARIQAVQPVAATVTVDSSQLTTALVTALSDAGLLAKEGAAIAHAEAVEEHNDTPAS